MTEIPDSAIHWMLGALVPAGGGLFIFLLKRTFHEFEVKLASLFDKLEKSLESLQDHDKRIDLLALRVKTLERDSGKRLTDDTRP